MPTVDYRLPGAHPGAVGMEITIFNPRLDTDGKILNVFWDILTSAFQNK